MPDAWGPGQVPRSVRGLHTLVSNHGRASRARSWAKPSLHTTIHHGPGVVAALEAAIKQRGQRGRFRFALASLRGRSPPGLLLRDKHTTKKEKVLEPKRLDAAFRSNSRVARGCATPGRPARPGEREGKRKKEAFPSLPLPTLVPTAALETQFLAYPRSWEDN